MQDSNKIDELINQAINFVNADNNSKAKQIIQLILNNKAYIEKLTPNNWQFIAHVCLITSEFELSYKCYLNSENLPGAAFVLILMKKLDDAEKILINASMSPACNWCKFLIDLFLEKEPLNQCPSFFAIRHFMELTVYCLLMSNNCKFIQLLVKNMNKLMKINPDAEKLTGYAYFHFGKYDDAIKLLNNSIKKDQYDGEIYYKLAQIYYLKNEPYEALSMLNNAQLFLPDHYPTKVLLEKVEAMISE